MHNKLLKLFSGLMMLVGSTPGIGQVSFHLTLRDSSELSLPSGCTSFLSGSTSQSFTHFLGTGLDQVSPQGEYSINFETEKLSHKPHRNPAVRFMAAWNDGFLVAEYWERKIYRMDAAGKVVGIFKLKTRYQGIPFDQFVWGVNNGVFIPDQGRLYLPALSIENDREVLTSHLKEAPGSLAIFQLKGKKFKLEKLIGPWRGVYGTEVYQPNLLAFVEVVNSSNRQEILLNPIADPRVRVYATSGHLLYEFGERGDHAYSEIEAIPEFSKKSPAGNQNQMNLGNTLYRGMKVDANGDYAYRLYLPGYPLDQIPATMPKDEEAQSSVLAKLDSLRAFRPGYLQIYDMQAADRPLLKEIKLPMFSPQEILVAENGRLSILASRSDKPNYTRIYDLDLGLTKD